jgi:hypothetical protein
MKQFPWRDYAWAVIIVGLLIGWAIEHQRLHRYRQAEQNAHQWEDRARELGDQLDRRLGAPMHINLYKHIKFIKPGNNFAELTVYESVVQTRDFNFSFLTGMLDLDVMLLILLMFAVIFPISISWNRNQNHEPKRTWAKNGNRQFRKFIPFVALLPAVAAISNFAIYMPFYAIMHLTIAAILMAHGIRQWSKSDAEVDQEFEERFDKQREPSYWRTALQLSLRDILCLMVIVGLTITIVMERRQAMRLSQQRGHARWWERVASKLQDELAALDRKAKP